MEDLVRATLTYWRRQAKQRRITTPLLAAVAWRWAAADVAAPAADLHPLLPAEGVVTRLRTELYASAHAPGRIVILGGPGAGKTSAMLLLLVDVLAARPPGSDEPVPVWLSLGGWNPERTSLHEWAAATLQRMFPALEAPARLLRQERVALFLDGLDEMPPPLRARALQRLDHEAGGLRLVLTSRPEEFRDALTAGRLWHTAVVELRPVAPADAGPFLLAEQLGERRTAWREVAAALQRRPDGVAARTLTSPLALSLARDTYTHADPRALLDEDRFPAPDDLLRHLLTRVVDLAYQDLPAHARARAVRWLSWLAACQAGERDLRWWDIAPWTLPPPWGTAARWLERMISESGDPRLGVGVQHPPGQSPHERTLNPAAHHRQAVGFVGLIAGVCAASAVLCAGLSLIDPPDPRALMTPLAIQLSMLMLLGGGPAMWLWLAELSCLLRGRPVRFVRLLEDALERQVLRQVGPVYQFRHALLQDYLAARAAPFGAARG